MCQGCVDFADYEQQVDAIIAKELPKLLAQPLDTAVIYGEKMAQQ